MTCFAQETVTKDYLMGRITPSKDERFVKIGEFYLRKEVAESFLKMQKEAAKSKIYLTVISAMRTYGDQKRIWENKWKGIKPVNTDTKEFLPKPNPANEPLTNKERALKILQFTAMPSTSRHHWGTDFDINNVDDSYWELPRGRKEFAWLTENAGKFGFCQVYSANRDLGHKQEKWHWSYYQLAQPFTNQYIKLVSNADVLKENFAGADAADSVDAVGKFVAQINQGCK